MTLKNIVPVGLELLNVEAVAAMLNCSPRHVYRLSDAGRMPVASQARLSVRWSKASLEAWIANGCRPVRQTKGGGRA